MTNVFWILFIIVISFAFIFEMIHSLKRSNTTNRLINAYLDDLDNENLYDEIYDYCLKDYKLKKIMKKYGGTKEDIKFFHKKLMKWGNIKKGRRFAPISSFFYAYTLEYLFNHRNDDDKKVAMRMLNFFHI